MTLKFITRPPSPPYAKILLYGPPKTSKSTAACSVPGGTIYLNADTPNSLRYGFAKHNGEGRIQEADFSEGIMQVMIDVSFAIQQQTKGSSEERIFDTVVVDPVGDLHRRLLEETSSRAVRPKLSEYGDVSTHLERFCRMLCEAPINAIFICHDLPVRDESTGEVERLPWTGTSNPALGQKLMGMVDIVGYTGVVEQSDGSKDYVAQLVNGKGRRGGDRFACLGSSRSLNIAEWLTVIEEHETPRKSRREKRQEVQQKEEAKAERQANDEVKAA